MHMILRASLLVLITILCACGDSTPLTVGASAPQLDKTPAGEEHILVIGGTSGIGLETVKLALERGHRVTAMARRPERMTYTHPHLGLVQGNVLNLASVASAAEGVNAVVFAVGIPPTREPTSVFSQGTAHVLATLGPDQQLVMITGIGAGDSRGHGGFFYDRILQPLALGTIYADKDRAERLIQISERDWTIVRPGFLNDGASDKQYRVVTNLEDVTAGNISRADVAHFVLASLESGAFKHSTVLISN